MSNGHLDTTEVVDFFRKCHPDHRLIMSHYKDKTLFARFACNKIVQNMITHKEHLHLVLITPSGQVAQRTMGLLIDEKEGEEGEWRKIFEEMRQEASRSQALTYRPSPVTTRGHWRKGEFERPWPLEPLIETVGQILRRGQQLRLENLAGFIKSEKRSHHILASDGADATVESSCQQLDMSGFRQQYEITTSQMAGIQKPFNYETSLQCMDEWLSLPTDNFPAEAVAARRPLRAVLSQQAVSSLMAYAVYTDNFNALSLREGTSPLKEFLGKRLLDEKINLMDNPRPEKILFSPFDTLGHLRKPWTIVENGIFNNPLYTEREAQHEGASYFGQCQGLREMAAYPFDLELLGTSKSMKMLWEEMGDGYYLHDLHYLSISDPRKMTVFGLTRGGLLEIRGGRPVKKIQNMRFEVNLLELFSQVDSIGQSEECQIWHTSVMAPSLLARGITFTQPATNI